MTTNKGFEEWGSVLGDDVMATAMLDRLLHRCHVVNIQGASYRMQEYWAKRLAVHSKATGIGAKNDRKTGEAAVAPPPPSPEVAKSGTF